MTNTAWITRQTKTPEARRNYERERLMVWALDCIAETMEAQGKSKADVARILGTSRAHITQVFAGDRNVTLRTLADLAFACDSRVTIATEPLCAMEFAASPVSRFEPLQIQYVNVEDAGPAPAPVATHEDETNEYALAA